MNVDRYIWGFIIGIITIYIGINMGFLFGVLTLIILSFLAFFIDAFVTEGEDQK